MTAVAAVLLKPGPGTGREAAPAPVAAADTAQEETPGALQILDKDGKPAGFCPLEHTDVQADISGFIARVTVTQKFANPGTEKIEAVYTFPLSQDAAVDDMVMKVGERTIRGKIERREEAQRIYEEAKEAGHVASLLDQERPNIFTQSVANIMPGENVAITISYVEYLNYKDGGYQFVFPMVVGPRFIPGNATGHSGTGWAPDTTNVPDASKITPPVTPEGTRAGHDISVSVNLDAGTTIGDLSSRLHEVDITKSGSTRATVTLKDKKTIPNKDFILDYKVAGEDIKDAVLTHGKQGTGGFFTLIMMPPERVTTENVVSKEMIFVIDTSGSMGGWPIEKAKETMKYAIRNMNENDTFNLIAFSNTVKPLFPAPQPNNSENREKADRYLARMMGNGGTMMMPAMDAALNPAPDPERLRVVCFMTDGYVGNDFEIIDTLQKKLGGARLFSFGIGNGVNRFLLDEMAKFGRGEVEYVTLEDQGKGAAGRFYERIENPVLTDIAVDWDGLDTQDLYPATIPDLYSHKPLVIKGRYSKAGKGSVTVRGRAAGRDFERTISVTFPESEPAHDVLAPLWARARIADLMSKDYEGMQNGQPNPEIKELITGLGLEYRLMTQFTSFVAVEEKIVTEGGVPTTVTVPVEMPEGVSYDGVFGEVADQSTMASFGGGGVRSANKMTLSKPAMPAPSPGVIASLEIEEDIAVKDYGISEEERNNILKTRLAAVLLDLEEKVDKEGSKGTLVTAELRVEDWQVRIRVKATDVIAAAANLKSMGFVEISREGGDIIGWIRVWDLEAAAMLDIIEHIDSAP